jgi:hypothetical protein
MIMKDSKLLISTLANITHHSCYCPHTIFDLEIVDYDEL